MTVDADGKRETQELDMDGPSQPAEEYKHPDPHFAEHLNGLFPTLQFPPELARRILTHGSHPAAAYGHNAAYSFMGAVCWHPPSATIQLTFYTFFRPQSSRGIPASLTELQSRPASEA